MNKLFGLFLLALAFLAPLPANAACAGGNCFWILGTGTVDGTSDIGHWATTSGGASCACVPATTDTITFDGSSGGGTVTVNMAGAIWTTNQLVLTNFTGTLDFAINSNSWTSTSNFIENGAATKTLNLGSGTFTLSGANSLWQTSGAGLTLNSGTATIAYTNAAGSSGNFRRFNPGTGRTYSTLTIAGNSTVPFEFTGGATTIGTWTISAPAVIALPATVTLTVTTMTNVTGTSSTPVSFMADGVQGGGRGIISSANNWTCTWCTFNQMQFQGGGTFTANNSLSLLNNTGITINPPSAGGGGGGRIIGG